MSLMSDAPTERGEQFTKLTALSAGALPTESLRRRAQPSTPPENICNGRLEHTLSPLAAWTRSSVSGAMMASGVPWIEHADIEFGAQIGAGAFGVVHRAKLGVLT